MLRELVHGLTTEQRTALKALGVDRILLHKWKHGLRLPTEAQVAMLAAVTGTEYGQLQREVTWLRLKPDERAGLARVLGKSVDAVKGALLGVVVMLATFGVSDRAQAAGVRLEPTTDNV
jgi:hypothetical protein